jgi:hypothetical protein
VGRPLRRIHPSRAARKLGKIQHADRHWRADSIRRQTVFLLQRPHVPHSPYYLRGKPEQIPKQLVESDVNIGLATLRIDGFVSLQDHFGGGTVLTKPLIFQGNKLHLNVNCRHGAIRVELLDGDGTTIPGYSFDDCLPIQADRIDLPVRWSNGSMLPDLAGKSVRLKFHLQNAKLFSFWIE